MLHMFSYAGISIGTACGVWLGVMTIDRDPPVIMVDRVLETHYVTRGSTLKYRNIVNRKRICSAHIERFLNDGQNYRHQLPSTTATYIGPLGIMTYGQTLEIPRLAHSGDAELHVTVNYVCNPLHNWYPIVVRNPPLKFTIIE